VRNGKLQEGLKTDIVTTAHRFRQQLRKAHKKLRKGSSNIQINYNDDFEDEPDAIVTYLELVNDFIKANMQEEMNEHLGIKTHANTFTDQELNDSPTLDDLPRSQSPG
jgi:hypothetical protein